MENPRWLLTILTTEGPIDHLTFEERITISRVSL